MRTLGLALCLVAVIGMVGCTYGPIGKFSANAQLEKQTERWSVGDWIDAGFGWLIAIPATTAFLLILLIGSG